MTQNPALKSQLGVTALKNFPSEQSSKQSSEMVQPPRLRPQRVVARRQKELLCTFQFQELEWMELDDVDTESSCHNPSFIYKV